MEQQSLQEHIAWLEGQLQQKKQELATRGVSEHNEREAVKEVLQGVGAEIIPPPPPMVPSPSQPSALALPTVSDDQKEGEHTALVQKLVEKAVSENLFRVIKEVEALRNPHLLDEFHDALADHYYEKLLESRKLKAD